MNAGGNGYEWIPIELLGSICLSGVSAGCRGLDHATRCVKGPGLAVVEILSSPDPQQHDNGDGDASDELPISRLCGSSHLWGG